MNECLSCHDLATENTRLRADAEKMQAALLEIVRVGSDSELLLTAAGAVKIAEEGLGLAHITGAIQ